VHAPPAAGVTVVSQSLATGQRTSTAATSIYTVPSGKRTILKSIVVNNGNAGANRIVVEILNGGTVVAAMSLFAAAGGSNNDTPILQPWVVLETGWTISILSTQQPYYYALSGAELIL
jgi:hypothetical protein